MFRKCLEDLDMAARLDPAGDDDPSVKALHASAREAVKQPK